MQIEEPSQSAALRVPENCKCYFDVESSTYIGVLNIINSSDSTLYFHIVSTFVHFLKLDKKVSQINPSSSLQLHFKIRQINQIHPGRQFILLSWSKKKRINEYCSSNESTIEKIPLTFDQQMIEDEQIDRYLQQEADKIFINAQVQFDEGNFKNAGQLFEESFLLYRKKLQGLMGLIKSLLEEKQFKLALNSLELYIFMKGEHLQEANLLKAHILEIFMQQATKQQKYQFLREAFLLYKNMHESKTIRKGMKIKADRGYERLSKIKDALTSEEAEYLFKNLIQMAINKFETNNSLKECFSSQKAFSNELNNIIATEEKDAIQTPQYAIDPIQYEIYKDPVITPAGHSYERQFLIQFINKHGHKDPHTRTYLSPNQVVPNITLKILVRNNPQLPKWLKYEQQSCKF